jgi:hypothetical protein
MALWGNKDNVGAGGTVLLDYSTGVVTGAGTTFGNVGAAKTGMVIRIGDKAGTYYGDAVIISVASNTSLTIGSTIGLSGVAIAATTFQVSELPKYTVTNPEFSENSLYTGYDKYVYGIGSTAAANAQGSQYAVAHSGWVGVTTYLQNDGQLRVKQEVLVAGVGIQTGNTPTYPPA